MRSLYLFTNTYPSAEQITEYAFIGNEIGYLIKHFNVIVVPIKRNKEFSYNASLLQVDYSLSSKVQLTKTIDKLLSVFDPYFFKEILVRPGVLFSITKLNRLLNHLSISRFVLNWLNRKIINDNDILYTYWFTAVTTGIGRYSNKKNNLIAISRAHGIDLFEERTGYIPLQNETIKMLNKLFVASNAGANYLTNKFKNKRTFQKIDVSYLGTKNYDFLSKHSDDSNIRLLSCSSMIDIKRIDLIINAIYYFINKYNIKVYWTHIGNGPLFEKLRLLALEKGLVFNFTGGLNNDDVINFYKTNQIDFFITTSASEGGCPVSVQEAMSFGIPIIATAVGGLPEMVMNENGLLLSENPTPLEIGDAVKYLNDNKEISLRMRNSAKKIWLRKFNADNNYDDFIIKILELHN